MTNDCPTGHWHNERPVIDDEFNLDDYVNERLISPPDGGLADVIGPIMLGLIFTAYIVYLIVHA